MKVRIITQESFHNWTENRSGSSRIRGRWLVKYWPEAAEFKIGEDCDVLIFQKAYWQEMMRDFKGTKILDICDPDFLAEPLSAGIVEMMTYCDACVTSTDSLAEEVRKYTNKPVVCIADRFDLEYYSQPKIHTNGPATRVVWHGYSHNAHVLDSTYASLKELGLQLLAISDTAIMEADEWVKYDWATVTSYMKSCDISLMPNHKSRKFKSNNKTVESWLCGLPVATNYEDLKRLIDPTTRAMEAKEKYAYAVKNFNITQSVVEYKSLIQRL